MTKMLLFWLLLKLHLLLWMQLKPLKIQGKPATNRAQIRFFQSIIDEQIDAIYVYGGKFLLA